MTAGIAGLILAGGNASRLGGGDKTLRQIGGRRMLDHIVRRLQPQVTALAISANGDPVRFADFRLPVIADATPERLGPLAGILAGMRWAAASGFARLLTVAGDTPFFPVDLASRLAEAAEGRIAVAACAGRDHPVFALWPSAAAEDLSDFVANAPRLSVRAFLDRHETVSVGFAPMQERGSAIDPFFNVNTPEDLAQAEAIARSLES